MGLFDKIFGGGDTKATAYPRVLPSQEELIKEVSAFLQKYIGKGAAPYPGQLVAEPPGLFNQAYEQYEKAFAGDLGALSNATIRDLIGGKPAYSFDPEETTSRWQETYAGPVMEMWNQTVLPSIKEGFNIPGVAYSRARGRETGRAASEFYGQYVAPSLFTALQTGEQMGFQSAEAAAGRQPAALGLPGQQFTQAAGVAGTLQAQLQRGYTADYQEWLRTRAEPGWPVQAATQFMTQPTQDWVIQQEPSTFDEIMQMATIAAMAIPMGGGGGGGGQQTYFGQQPAWGTTWN